MPESSPAARTPQEFFDTLLGVRANARRVASGASAFVHRASPRDLLVAVHANVELGELAPAPGGLLALGRARHMGGGLLEPVRGDDS